jgi:hypothetical protein
VDSSYFPPRLSKGKIGLSSNVSASETHHEAIVRHGFSRRSWLLSVFSGLAALAGLRRGPEITSAVPRTDASAQPVSGTTSWGYDAAVYSSGPMTTFVYDGASRLLSVHQYPVTCYAYDGKVLRADA